VSGGSLRGPSTLPIDAASTTVCFGCASDFSSGLPSHLLTTPAFFRNLSPINSAGSSGNSLMMSDITSFKRASKLCAFIYFLALSIFGFNGFELGLSSMIFGSTFSTLAANCMLKRNSLSPNSILTSCSPSSSGITPTVARPTHLKTSIFP